MSTEAREVQCQAAELAIHQKTECVSADLIDQAATNGIYKYMPEEEKVEL